jgi:hypothetical protein
MQTRPFPESSSPTFPAALHDREEFSIKKRSKPFATMGNLDRAAPAGDSDSHMSPLSQRSPARIATRGKPKGPESENTSRSCRLVIEAAIRL